MPSPSSTERSRRSPAPPSASPADPPRRLSAPTTGRTCGQRLIDGDPRQRHPRPRRPALPRRHRAVPQRRARPRPRRGGRAVRARQDAVPRRSPEHEDWLLRRATDAPSGTRCGLLRRPARRRLRPRPPRTPAGRAGRARHLPAGTLDGARPQPGQRTGRHRRSTSPTSPTRTGRGRVAATPRCGPPTRCSDGSARTPVPETSAADATRTPGCCGADRTRR